MPSSQVPYLLLGIEWQIKNECQIITLLEFLSLSPSNLFSCDASIFLTSSVSLNYLINQVSFNQVPFNIHCLETALIRRIPDKKCGECRDTPVNFKSIKERGNGSISPSCIIHTDTTNSGQCRVIDKLQSVGEW